MAPEHFATLGRYAFGGAWRQKPYQRARRKHGFGKVGFFKVRFLRVSAKNHPFSDNLKFIKKIWKKITKIIKKSIKFTKNYKKNRNKNVFKICLKKYKKFDEKLKKKG